MTTKVMTMTMTTIHDFDGNVKEDDDGEDNDDATDKDAKRAETGNEGDMQLIDEDGSLCAVTTMRWVDCRRQTRFIADDRRIDDGAVDDAGVDRLRRRR